MGSTMVSRLKPLKPSWSMPRLNRQTPETETKSKIVQVLSEMLELPAEQAVHSWHSSILLEIAALATIFRLPI